MDNHLKPEKRKAVMKCVHHSCDAVHANSNEHGHVEASSAIDLRSDLRESLCSPLKSTHSSTGKRKYMASTRSTMSARDVPFTPMLFFICLNKGKNVCPTVLNSSSANARTGVKA